MNPIREALYYRLVGYYYNYPTCCIESYVKARLANQLHALRIRAALAREYGFPEGFVPCRVCAQRVGHRLLHQPTPTLAERRLQLRDVDQLRRLAQITEEVYTEYADPPFPLRDSVASRLLTFHKS
jgi:hypothetical protein